MSDSVKLDELARRIQSGDWEAFHALVHETFVPLRAYVAFFIADSSTAEDIIQEVYTQLYREIDRYRPGSDLMAWIKTLARNAALAARRRQGRERSASKRYQRETLLRLESHVEARESQFPLEDQIVALRRCVEKLPEKLRELVKLRYFEGQTLETIAQVRQMTFGAAAMSLHRIPGTACALHGGGEVFVMKSKPEELLRLWIEDLLTEQEAPELLQAMEQDSAFAVRAADMFMIDRLLFAHANCEQNEERVLRSLTVLRDEAGQKEGEARIQKRLSAEQSEFEVRRNGSARRKPVAVWRGGSTWLAVAATLLLATGLAFWNVRTVPQVENGITSTAQTQAVESDMLATVLNASGVVFSMPSTGSQKRMLKPGEQIGIGNKVVTGDDGTATLRFLDDATTMEVGSQASVLITRPAGKHLLLESGQIACDVARQPEGRPMVLESSTARATVLGTRLSLDVKSDLTSLQVREGRVSFLRLADQQEIAVGTGEAAAAIPGTVFAARPLRLSDHQLLTTLPPIDLWRGQVLQEENFDAATEGALPVDWKVLPSRMGLLNEGRWDAVEAHGRKVLRGQGAWAKIEFGAPQGVNREFAFRFLVEVRQDKATQFAIVTRNRPTQPTVLNIQNVAGKNVDLFDGSWHTVQASFRDDRAVFWFDGNRNLVVKAPIQEGPIALEIKDGLVCIDDVVVWALGDRTSSRLP